MKKAKITHKFNVNGSFVDAMVIPDTKEDNAAGILGKFLIFSFKYGEAGEKKYFLIGEIHAMNGDTFNIHIFDFKIYGLVRPNIKLELIPEILQVNIDYNEVQ